MYRLKVSGCAPFFFPTIVLKGFLWLNEKDKIEIPEKYPFQDIWGEIGSDIISNNNIPIPVLFDITWISIVEHTSYSITEKLPVQQLNSLFAQVYEKTNNPIFEYINIGMAPYGGVAIWSSGFKKTVLIKWMHADETQEDSCQLKPLNLTIPLIDICDFYINNDSRVKENLEINGLPPHDLFDNYMKQFTYRYLPLFEHWDDDEEKWLKYTEEEQEKKPELDYIEEALYDGTHDKLHDGGLLNYHEAGKPKKLCMKWHIKKSEYAAYYWLDDQAIRTIFDKFYGTHPDTKTDFIIHVDTIKNKYQLALYRYGLKEPVIIPEDAYQLIVFKNMFEYFRSENYDQPKGAWIW